MEFGEENFLTKTGLFRVAKEKPVRPLNSSWLVGLGTMVITFCLVIVYAVAINNQHAAFCACAAALLIMWFAISFLWNSVSQLSAKVNALTNIAEREKADKEKRKSSE